MSKATAMNVITSRSEVKNDDVNMSKFNIFTLRANQRIYQEIIAKRNYDKHYIEALEALLQENSIELPVLERNAPSPLKAVADFDGSHGALNALLMKIRNLQQIHQVQICFKDLGYWTKSPKPHIPTVGTTIRNMFIGYGPKERVDILKGLTGSHHCSLEQMNTELTSMTSSIMTSW
jgi:hypothetical protein